MGWGVTFFIFTFETVFPENPKIPCIATALPVSRIFDNLRQNQAISAIVPLAASIPIILM